MKHTSTLLLLLLLACGPRSNPKVPVDNMVPPAPTGDAPATAGLTLSPANAQMVAGDLARFTVNAEATDVTFTVSAGHIDSDGTFEAPFAAGSVTVTATAKLAGTSVSATASVTVALPPAATIVSGSIIGAEPDGSPINVAVLDNTGEVLTAVTANTTGAYHARNAVTGVIFAAQRKSSFVGYNIYGMRTASGSAGATLALADPQTPTSGPPQARWYGSAISKDKQSALLVFGASTQAFSSTNNLAVEWASQYQILMDGVTTPKQTLTANGSGLYFVLLKGDFSGAHTVSIRSVAGANMGVPTTFVSLAGTPLAGTAQTANVLAAPSDRSAAFSVVIDNLNHVQVVPVDAGTVSYAKAAGTETHQIHTIYAGTSVSGLALAPDAPLTSTLGLGQAATVLVGNLFERYTSPTGTLSITPTLSEVSLAQKRTVVLKMNGASNMGALQKVTGVCKKGCSARLPADATSLSLDFHVVSDTHAIATALQANDETSATVDFDYVAIYENGTVTGTVSQANPAWTPVFASVPVCDGCGCTWTLPPSATSFSQAWGAAPWTEPIAAGATAGNPIGSGQQVTYWHQLCSPALCYVQTGSVFAASCKP